MNERGRGHVCIIGAGVAGLVTAKVLKEDGFEVTIFEKDSTPGGVWVPSRAYPGLRTNNPRETYAFSDYAYPEGTEDFPTATRIMEYLTSYAKHFGLTQHLRLSTEVISVSRNEATGSADHPGFRVSFARVGDAAEPETEHFDFVVVCNGVFSEPYLPEIDGAQQFAGAILHSSQIREPDALRGKRVVIVGAGKSALDCATFAAREGASATLVFRSPHWMLPRYVGGRRVDRFAFLRVSVSPYYPPYHNVGPVERALRTAAATALWLCRKGASRLIVRLSGIPDVMVPEYPHVAGIENQGIGEDFYRVLNDGHAQAKRASISCFSGGDQVALDSRETIYADVVIFATGWRQTVPFLDDELSHEVRKDGDGRFALYRNILPPQEPRLGFIGYASSGNAPLTSEVSAHWLSECFMGHLALPRSKEMEQEIARVEAWTNRTFPRRNQGYFIGAYVVQYIDELLRDMGLPTKRTRSLLSEYLKPVWAERYRGLAEERRRMRDAGRNDFRPPP